MPGFPGRAVYGFSVRGECGIRPSIPASDLRVREPLSLSSSPFDVFATRSPRRLAPLMVLPPAGYHQPRSFHQPKPTVLQIAIVANDAIKPYFHHSRCVTYRAPK